MYITEPNNPADVSVYENVQKLADLPSTDTNAVIDGNPLFQNAELFITRALPAAALTPQGQGRAYTHRDQVLLALGFIAASYFISGSAPATTTVEGTGAIKSETIGQVSRSYDTGGTVVSQTLSVKDRSAFLYEQGVDILERLIGDAPSSLTKLRIGIGISNSRTGV